MAQLSDAARARFEEFVRANGDRLLHTAYGLCGDWQHAEDLVQVTLSTMAARWDSIERNALGYAYRCLSRSTVDRWRRLGRRPEVVSDPVTLRAATASDPDVAERLSVLAALQTLPERQRAIVVLRYLQDLSEADTAGALGITVGAVKSGASRGLARLRAGAFQEVEQ
ncbi:MAG TPA: SigE family RNA polymerase sigma factor [Jatrophihabitans sp.]|jgi:RNA polymerase sigma-70 factor (sigma-E family)|uniref:SigE family RNA polymerase sigma factor n=1 Tax=Jatrophihabitans sp. TaxID=1932789 RepID=UPI002DFD9AF6|nr:SigE family RNA polymerase sigma factor [Jatrophihabitans sp.]